MRNGRSCSWRMAMSFYFRIRSAPAASVRNAATSTGKYMHHASASLTPMPRGAWLQGQNYVRGDHISLLGWSNGGVAALWTVRLTKAPARGHRRFPLGRRVLSELPPLARNRMERPGPDPHPHRQRRRLDTPPRPASRWWPAPTTAARACRSSSIRARTTNSIAPIPRSGCAPASSIRSILPGAPMAAPILPLAPTHSSGCRPGSRDSETRRGHRLQEMKRRANGYRRGGNSKHASSPRQTRPITVSNANDHSVPPSSHADGSNPGDSNTGVTSLVQS